MPYLWFSHGHPDHFHTDSIDLIPIGKTLLVGESYHSDMKEYLEYLGHTVRVLKYREWVDLGDGVRICCMNNLNQDAILVIETPDGLIVNKNERLLPLAPAAQNVVICACVARRVRLMFLYAEPLET